MYNDERRRVGTRKMDSHAGAWEPERKLSTNRIVNADDRDSGHRCLFN